MTSPSSPSNASPSFKIHHLFFSFFILGAWLIYMTIKNQWFLFIDNWFMSVTMLFGSFIAGATAEGGGAVAFPVMTLVFKIPPAVARNFSLAIQSCGMTSAAYLIFTRGIKIEKTYLTLCTLGGFFGIIFGTYAIVPLVTPIYAKMFFVSLWLSFGIVLYVMNLHPERVTVETLPPLKTAGLFHSNKFNSLEALPPSHLCPSVTDTKPVNRNTLSANVRKTAKLVMVR